MTRRGERRNFKSRGLTGLPEDKGNARADVAGFER